MKPFDTYQSKKTLRSIIDNQQAYIQDLVRENTELTRQLKAANRKAAATKAVKKATTARKTVKK
jgi:uncharacterized membrane protein YfhO